MNRVCFHIHTHSIHTSRVQRRITARPAKGSKCGRPALKTGASLADIRAEIQCLLCISPLQLYYPWGMYPAYLMTQKKMVWLFVCPFDAVYENQIRFVPHHKRHIKLIDARNGLDKQYSHLGQCCLNFNWRNEVKWTYIYPNAPSLTGHDTRSIFMRSTIG